MYSQNTMLQVNSHRKSCFSQNMTNDLISNFLINDIKSKLATFLFKVHDLYHYPSVYGGTWQLQVSCVLAMLEIATARYMSEVSLYSTMSSITNYSVPVPLAMLGNTYFSKSISEKSLV